MISRIDDVITDYPEKLNSRLSNIQMIALGFFILIATGACLLKLPYATESGVQADWLTCIFTATSASCVTGLVVADTFLYWSKFGQIVIITLIQIGGLGFMSIGIFFMFFFQQNVRLSQRGLLVDSVNAMEFGGIKRLVRFIIGGTAITEGIGAICLAFTFIPMLGIREGVYYSIFHSISAFCNGGFDLMGRYGAYGSLSMFYDNIWVNLVVMLLITVGGLGFLVWQDIYDHIKTPKRFSLQTKVVLSMTGITFVVTTILFLIFEWNESMADMSFTGKILSSMFSTVTARTAGFNTVDTGALSDAGKLLTIFLMFMGGSPGSTAGGIKTTTVVVVFVYLWSSMRNSSGYNIFGRRFDDETVKKASMVFYINILLACTGLLFLSYLEDMNFIDIFFEVFSAIGTAGMTTGITRDLCDASKMVLILLMYCGRIGSLTFAMSFVERKRKSPLKNPVEQVTVG